MSLNNLNELPDIWKRRLEFIDDITDQEMLIHLALRDDNRFIQIKAIGKVKDKDILEEIALNSKDWEVRFEALKHIDNQSVFKRLALNDRRSEVRQLAASHIDDEELLKQIATKDIDKDVSLEALKRIKSYSNYVYVLNHCKHSDVCLDAIMNIYDEKLLEDFALNHPNHNVRRIACKRIKNQSVLKRVVCFEKYYDIKKIAFEKIDNPEAFLYIADHAKSPHITHSAIFQIPHENIFVDYILDGKVFLDIYFPMILPKVRQKSNLKRIICNSDNILLCKYLIRNIEDGHLLNQALGCNIDEKLVLEIENRIRSLKDKT